jgi:hypothetical protein
MTTGRFTSLLLGLSALALSGCTWVKDAHRLEKSRLEFERDQLRTLKTQLETNAFPPANTELGLFVSYAALNDVLAGADNFEFPLPAKQKVTIRIERIRLLTEDGPPVLQIGARGIARGGRIQLGVQVFAYLFFEQVGSDLFFQVRVKDIAPELTWQCLKVTHLTVAQAIATAKADELALNRLRFPVPTQAIQDLSLRAVDDTVRIDTRNNGSYLQGRAHRPEYPYHTKLTLLTPQPVFLRDGIHLYAKLVKEPK